MKKLVLLILTIGILNNITIAQQVQLDKTASDLTIEGTSSLHDWEIKAEKLSGRASFRMTDGTLDQIDNLQVTIDVDGLKSGKSGMDDNTYKALKNKQHPKITYILTEVIDKKAIGNGFELDTKGRLTIAGETKVVNMKVKTSASIPMTIEGETTFKMTDFKIDPPTAMFGTVKTGDAVTIKFNVTLK